MTPVRVPQRIDIPRVGPLASLARRDWYAGAVQLTAPVAPLDRWALAPDIVHLNHGSYGGCPRVVIDVATAIRARLEAAPMRFLVLEWQAELDRARAALCELVGASPSRLVFVPSATTGVATALASVELAAGDEILVTSHGYRAVKNQLVRLADAHGARIVIVPIAMPYDPDALVEGISAAITSRTKLAVLDHITSPTALCIPLERIIPLLGARGIQVLVDGAHGPGQLDLDISSLGATWYTGNNHKWLCAPKGTGFLVTTTELRPLVTSHGASPEYGPPNRLHAELDWMGTHDPTPHLTVPTAIATIAGLGGGWPQTIARNHALVIEMRRRLIDALGGDARHLLAPESALGSMAAVPIALPAGVTPLALQTRLLTDGWEVPIVDFATGPLVRISAHLYNYAAQADDLARQLHALGVRIRNP